MFGFGFGGKVKKVLRDKFNYSPGAIQTHILEQMINQGKLLGVNEYDVAILFMATQMDTLMGSDPSVKTFVQTHTRNIESVASMASAPYSDIVELVSQLRSKHGLGDRGGVQTENNSHLTHSTFEEWYSNFKTVCGIYNSSLKPSDNGSCLVDFVDHEPLKRAYRAGVSPGELGQEWALNFDPLTFGIKPD